MPKREGQNGSLTPLRGKLATGSAPSSLSLFVPTPPSRKFIRLAVAASGSQALSKTGRASAASLDLRRGRYS